MPVVFVSGRERFEFEFPVVASAPPPKELDGGVAGTYRVASLGDPAWHHLAPASIRHSNKLS